MEKKIAALIISALISTQASALTAVSIADCRNIGRSMGTALDYTKEQRQFGVDKIMKDGGPKFWFDKMVIDVVNGIETGKYRTPQDINEAAYAMCIDGKLELERMIR